MAIDILKPSGTEAPPAAPPAAIPAAPSTEGSNADGEFWRVDAGELKLGSTSGELDSGSSNGKEYIFTNKDAANAKKFLVDVVRSAAQLREINPKFFDPKAPEYNEYLDRLWRTLLHDDAEITAENRMEVVKRMDTMLHTSQGWEITLMLLDNDIARKSMGLGYIESLYPPAKNSVSPEGKKERLEKRGALRAGVDLASSIVPWVKRNQFQSGLIGGATGVDATTAVNSLVTTNSPVEAAATFVGLAAIEVAGYFGYQAGKASLTNEGIVQERVFDQDMFNFIKSTNASKKYFEALTGINLDEYTWDTDKPKLKDQRIAPETKVAQLQENIDMRITLRDQLLERVGSPKEEHYRTAEQIFLDLEKYVDKDFLPEQTGLKIEKEIMDIVRYGKKDRNGNYLPGLEPLKDSYGDKYGAALDWDYVYKRDAIALYFQAREYVLVQRFRSLAGKMETIESTQIDDDLARVRKIKEAYGSTGARTEAASKTYTDEENALTKERSKLVPSGEGEQTPQQKLDTYTQALQRYEETQRVFRDKYKIGDTEAGIDAEITAIESGAPKGGGDNLQKIEKDIYDLAWGAADSIEADTQKFYVARVKQIEETTAKIAAAAKKPPNVTYDEDKIMAEAERKATELHQSKMNELKRKEQELKTRIEELKALKTQLKEQRQAATDAQSALVGEAPKNLEGTTTAALADVTKVTGIDIDTLKAQGYKDLLKTINDRYEATKGGAAGPIEGWPADQNAEKLDTLLYAITESRVQQRESLDFERNKSDGRLENFNKLVKLPDIDEEALRTLTTAQLLARINTAKAAGSADAWDPADNAANLYKLEMAIFEARNKVALRQGTFVQEKLNYIDTRLKELGEVKSDIKFEDKIEQLTTIEGVLSNRININHTFANAVYINRDSKFTTLANPTEGYAKEIIDANVPQGYIELLDVIFGFNNPDKAGEAGKLFKQATEILPQDEMAKIFADILGFTIPGATPKENHMKYVLHNMNHHKTSRNELYDVAQAVLIRLGVKGKSI